MIVSSKGRYALRVLIDLAEHQDAGFTPMKDVAARQGISLKYLERILPPLVKYQFIEGLHGKGGGYRLIKSPETCRVGDILRVTEGDLCTVSCPECNRGNCERADICPTVHLWNGLDAVVQDYLNQVTLADLMQKQDSVSCVDQAENSTD